MVVPIFQLQIASECVQSDSFIVIGYEPSSAALGGIGRLLLAAYKGDELVYVGGVGSGFKERERKKLRKDLDALKTSKPAVALKRKVAFWVQPTLMPRLSTGDGRMTGSSVMLRTRVCVRSRIMRRFMRLSDIRPLSRSFVA
jgi:hypothetical protein